MAPTFTALRRSRPDASRSNELRRGRIVGMPIVAAGLLPNCNACCFHYRSAESVRFFAGTALSICSQPFSDIGLSGGPFGPWRFRQC